MRRRSAVIASSGSGLFVLVAALVYALADMSSFGGGPDDDSMGARSGIFLVWLLLAIGFAACGTYGAVRGRLVWVWLAGPCVFLQALVLVSIGGGFWAMFLGAGLVVLAAVVGGGRRGNLESRPT